MKNLLCLALLALILPERVGAQSDQTTTDENLIADIVKFPEQHAPARMLPEQPDAEGTLPVLYEFEHKRFGVMVLEFLINERKEWNLTFLQTRWKYLDFGHRPRHIFRVQDPESTEFFVDGYMFTEGPLENILAWVPNDQESLLTLATEGYWYKSSVEYAQMMQLKGGIGHEPTHYQTLAFYYYIQDRKMFCDKKFVKCF